MLDCFNNKGTLKNITKKNGSVVLNNKKLRAVFPLLSIN